MLIQHVWIVLGLLAALILVVFSLNFYFMLRLNADVAVDTSHGKLTPRQSGYFHQLKKRVRTLKPIYLNRNPQYYRMRNKLWRNFEEKPYENATTVWDITFWVSDAVSNACIEMKCILIIFN